MHHSPAIVAVEAVFCLFRLNGHRRGVGQADRLDMTGLRRIRIRKPAGGSPLQLAGLTRAADVAGGCPCPTLPARRGRSYLIRAGLAGERSRRGWR